MEFYNVYDDSARADSYSGLEFPNTYYLAYRDIPEILFRHVKGKKAVDFGCGTGRSTRFIKKYGFEAAGIDISEAMVSRAKEIDPSGEYYRVDGNDFNLLKQEYYDLVLSIFTFDNIPEAENRVKILLRLKKLLNNGGRMIILDSAPECYRNEWASFSSKDFPENKTAKSGDKVRVVMKDVKDKRPVEDILWFHEDYLDLFEKSGLELIETCRPLGKPDEPFHWLAETKIAPWVIYVLKRREI